MRIKPDLPQSGPRIGAATSEKKRNINMNICEREQHTTIDALYTQKHRERRASSFSTS